MFLRSDFLLGWVDDRPLGKRQLAADIGRRSRCRPQSFHDALENFRRRGNWPDADDEKRRFQARRRRRRRQNVTEGGAVDNDEELCRKGKHLFLRHLENSPPERRSRETSAATSTWSKRVERDDQEARARIWNVGGRGKKVGWIIHYLNCALNLARGFSIGSVRRIV